MAQVSNTKDGYIVSEWFILPPDTYHRWHNLRNFGNRQSDAKNFAKDVDKLNEYRLNDLARNYKNEIKYKRITSEKFVKQTEEK